MRADLFLVEHGHAATRSQAQRLIAAGVQWRVDEAVAWKKVAKNGDEIPAGAELQLLDTTEAKYLSRGGLKLEGALKATSLSVAGLRCLDIGQSTGGFTDCLLQHGAVQVVGVDVGHGQLHQRLRDDARVVCIEGVNARSMTVADLNAPDLIVESAGGYGAEGEFDDFYDSDESDESDSSDSSDGSDARAHHSEPEPLAVPANFDVLTGDLSFISLTLVLPAVVRLLKAGGDVLMLVKPQFELQPGQIGKGGIVRDAAHFEFVEKRLRDACAALGLEVLAWLDSPIAGGDGNREFFIHARKGHDLSFEAQPLAAAPPRKTTKRVPRSELRAWRLPHEDSEDAHAGQHGPARSKRRDKTNDDTL